MYDVAIVGAGPAGATLARLIGNTHRVLLIDKRPLDCRPEGKSVEKCCGGLVAPDAQKVMAALGLGLPREVIVGPQLFAVRTIDLPNSIERYYQRFYINIDREKFDRWLVSLLPPKVDVRLSSLFKGFTKEEGGVRVLFTDKGKQHEERAKLLIGADGAFSLVRRQLGQKQAVPRRYVSIQEWFEAKKAVPYFSAVFDREITDFYSWTIPKDKYLIVGSALNPKDNAHEKFEKLKAKLQNFGFDLGTCVKREGAFILRPVSLSQVSTGIEGIALIGEAGGWISPSSAEGLSYAFRSAIAAAQSLQRGTDGFHRQYAREMLGLKANILVKNLKAPVMYHSLLRKAVMLSGLQSIDVCRY